MKKLILALLVAALCMVAPAAALDWCDVPGTEVIVIDYPYTHVCGSYFDVTIVSESTDYPGWCVQTGLSSIKNTPYEACLSTTLGESEQWNMINWIINNKGEATYGEVQAAIWMVLGQSVPASWDNAVSQGLAAAADPYFDECVEGNVAAVLVVPCCYAEEVAELTIDQVACLEGQALIIELPCPCECPTPAPEFPTMMIPVFLVGSVLVAASVLKKD